MTGRRMIEQSYGAVRGAHAGIAGRLDASRPRRSNRPRRKPDSEPEPTAVELEQSTGLLNRTHLRELGIERGAVDAVFRALDL